jgi:uncharacterized repeat protein (TIGR03803 family)
MVSRNLILAALTAAAALVQASPAAAIHTLYSFCQAAGCADGSAPYGGLVRDANGDLFGTTESGGTEGNSGVVYELIRNPDRAKWRYRVLYKFCSAPACEDGKNSESTLVIDAAGNLYGTAAEGGTANAGVVFKLSPNAGRKRWTYSVLWTFCAHSPKCKDGLSPAGGLTYAGASTGAPYDGHSVLFGFTYGGGKFNNGIAYSLQPDSAGDWKQKTLYRFCNNAGPCPGGNRPHGTPVLDAAGNLYGVAPTGGAQNVGVVFKLSPVSGSKFWTETLMHDFCSAPNCSDGSSPSMIVMDATGNVFGSASSDGGIDGCCGTLFKIASDGAFSVLYTFCTLRGCSDGALPAGLALTPSGDLFGVTAGGGTDRSAGTVFQFGGTLRTLYDFCRNGDCSSGSFPHSAPLLDDEGNLFGTAIDGQASSNTGTVYRLKQ